MDRNPNSSEIERNLDIAAKLLSARDLVGAKRFADLSLSSSSLSDDRADQILAVADVLLSAQKRPLNLYSILQISSNSFDLSTLKRNHRRLSQLLHPDRNPLPGADTAFRYINDAFNILSDPAKKADYDAEFFQGSDDSGFWTLCQNCCHVHFYARMYLNKVLKCQNCLKAFNAVELGSQPSIVPGTDMYYATWGFFPMGFANPGSTNWKPFVSVNANANGDGNGGAQQPPPGGDSGGPANGGKGPTGGPGRKKKTTARKKVMSGLKSRVFGNQENDDENGNSNGSGEKDEERARGININEAARGGGEEDINMIIDLDATDYMFSSLQNLPFLKDDGMNMQMPQVGNGGF